MQIPAAYLLKHASPYCSCRSAEEDTVDPAVDGHDDGMVYHKQVCCKTGDDICVLVEEPLPGLNNCNGWVSKRPDYFLQKVTSWYPVSIEDDEDVSPGVFHCVSKGTRLEALPVLPMDVFYSFRILLFITSEHRLGLQVTAVIGDDDLIPVCWIIKIKAFSNAALSDGVIKCGNLDGDKGKILYLLKFLLLLFCCKQVNYGKKNEHE